MIFLLGTLFKPNGILQSTTIGVDLLQHRIRIGNFNRARVIKNKGKYGCRDNIFSISTKTVFFLLYIVILVYLLPFLIKVHLDSISFNFKSKGSTSVLAISWTKFYSNSCILYLLTILSRLGCFGHLFRFPPVKSLTRSHIIIYSCISLTYSTILVAKLLFLPKVRTENLKIIFRNTIGPLKPNNSYSFYQIATLLLFLIILANISLLNPGPQQFEGLNCFFQNVQGFVTLNSIHKQHPDLNITKLIEFQTHIFENSPYIMLLNETWLKPTISDTEIIPSDNYRIFRRDRCPDSHPPDPENPNKCKANGGGVLKAGKNSLNLKPREIKTICMAELLSIELTFPCRSKYSLSTLYRVGTLGYNHICEVESHFYNIFSSKKYKKNFIIGDLNLKSIDWSTSTTSNRL